MSLDFYNCKHGKAPRFCVDCKNNNHKKIIKSESLRIYFMMAAVAFACCAVTVFEKVMLR